MALGGQGLAAEAVGWGSLSVAKAETAIDYWVDRYDPYALRRSELTSRGRHLDVVPADDGTGMAWIEGKLYTHDAAALDQLWTPWPAGFAMTIRAPLSSAAPTRSAPWRLVRIDWPAAAGRRECPAADGPPPSAAVVHVIAAEPSLADDAPVQLDGVAPKTTQAKPLREMTIAEALAPLPPTGPAHTDPAVVMGGGILPAPLLAAKLATTATIRPLIHPGDAPPEPRYTPSRTLSDFVRCRDLTCRFPNCDAPADRCDLDHTIAYPVGPTQASNLKCLCRKY